MAGWGAKFESIVTSFPGGVRTSARGDMIPSDTMPGAVNASWEDIGDGAASIAKRKGCALLNTGAAIDSALVGQAYYEKLASGTFTKYHMLFAEDGDLHSIASDGTVTNYTSGEFSTSITGQFVATAEAKNYLYVVAGTATTAGGVSGTMLRFDGTNWRVGGMAAPAAPTAVDNGAGLMNGTYEWALTYRNSNTGFESSRSPATTTTPINEQTDVSWAAPADAQVTHVNVYVRKASISTGFYRATSIAVGATTVTLNLSDSDYNALTVLAPDEDENDPPPSGVKYLAWHKSRLFAATDTEVYYSKVELPEAFDPEKYEPVNPSDGQKIAGILSVFDKLVVFKDRSVFALVGNGPNDWFIEEITTAVGCLAPASIVVAGGRVFWWSQDGPVVWDGLGAPEKLGKTLINTTIDPLTLNMTRLEQVIGVHDPRESRVMWAVPSAGQTRNDIIIPFKYQLGQFEGLWYAIQPASFVVGTDSSEREWVYIGGYGGRVYQWWTGKTDGVPSGVTAVGAFVPGASSISSITLSGLDTTTGYQDLYVSVVDYTTGEFIARRRITTSNSTTLTLASNLSGLTADSAYWAFIGNVDFVLDSKWQDDAAAFYKKRYEFLYLETLVDTGTTVFVELNTDWNEDSDHSRVWGVSATVDSGSGSSLWDVMLWDVGLWAQGAPETHRLRIAKTGKTWRVRITHSDPNSEFKLLKLGVRGEYLTDKR
jgi:hypothetical protein